MQSKVCISEIIEYDAIQSYRALVPHGTSIVCCRLRNTLRVESGIHIYTYVFIRKVTLLGCRRVEQIEQGQYDFGVLKSEENCTSIETWIPRNEMDTNRLYSCSSTNPFKMNVY